MFSAMVRDPKQSSLTIQYFLPRGNLHYMTVHSKSRSAAAHHHQSWVMQEQLQHRITKRLRLHYYRNFSSSEGTQKIFRYDIHRPVGSGAEGAIMQQPLTSYNTNFTIGPGLGLRRSQAVNVTLFMFGKFEVRTRLMQKVGMIYWRARLRRFKKLNCCLGQAFEWCLFKTRPCSYGVRVPSVRVYHCLLGYAAALSHWTRWILKTHVRFCAARIFAVSSQLMK